MIFDPSTAPQLRPWLIRTLEPVCDAEPGALADYILALLKHNVAETEMRKELAVQLEEFLEKECSHFIDTLFTVLRTKSYLPYSSASSVPNSDADTGIPIPLDGLLSPSMASGSDHQRKRNREGDEIDGRPPAKGPRLSNDGQFSRYSNGRNFGRDARSGGGWTGQHGGEMDGNNGMGYMNGRAQAYRPPDLRRGICRDYHNSGFCARGAMCKYSHGDDAVIPGQFFPMNGPSMGMGMPFMPMFPSVNTPYEMGGGGAYDPHQARMDMRPPMNGAARPQTRAPLLPRIQQEDGRVIHPTNVTGELPVIQDLTPSVQPSESQTQDSPDLNPSSSSNPLGLSSESATQTTATIVDGSVAPNGHASLFSQDPSASLMDVDGPRNPGFGGFHGRPRGGGDGRPRGRGTFRGEVHSFGSERKSDNKTLVVEKIPADKLTLAQVNDWFSKFGTVTNVAIDPSGGKALVSFASPEQAHAAWKSEDAVFNNRFVKVFWHRPMEGHGKLGARMLEASAPIVAITNKDTAAAASSATPAPAPPAAPPKKSITNGALAAKQQLLEKQIAEQKSLMASLASATPEEKKAIMGRLRKLGEEMSPKPNPAPASLSANGKTPPPAETDRERLEKERLDKELELLSHTEGESTEDLKAKLERLKVEAASLGIAETNHQPQYSGYRPYRGRARGARSSFYRGAMRGGPPVPRSSMKLDNRPKKLVINGVDADSVQALRDWYETTGQLDTVETLDNGDIIVSFKTRAAAEQGLAKGTQIPTVGNVQVAWHNPSAALQKSAMPISATVSKMEERASSPHLESAGSPPLADEEIVASGWGGDGDGEDGMGML